MNTAGFILAFAGKLLLVSFGVIVVGILIVAGYNVIFKDWVDYRKARKEIFEFVDSYKKRCTGNNRFVVTVETLQDSFREYNTNVIEKVWQELIDKRMIVSDPQDQVWCVR